MRLTNSMVGFRLIMAVNLYGSPSTILFQLAAPVEEAPAAEETVNEEPAAEPAVNSSGSVTVSADSIYVRSGPSTSDTIISYAYQGDSFDVNSTSGIGLRFP